MGAGSADAAVRRVVVALAALAAIAILTAVAVGLLTGFGGGPASASGASSASASRTVLAQPGDTLWELAVEHHGDTDLRRYVDALVDENGGSSIRAGQLVRLP